MNLKPTKRRNSIHLNQGSSGNFLFLVGEVLQPVLPWFFHCLVFPVTGSDTAKSRRISQIRKITSWRVTRSTIRYIQSCPKGRKAHFLNCVVPIGGSGSSGKRFNSSTRRMVCKGVRLPRLRSSFFKATTANGGAGRSQLLNKIRTLVNQLVTLFRYSLVTTCWPFSAELIGAKNTGGWTCN
jgi:hypothetical protein